MQKKSNNKIKMFIDICESKVYELPVEEAVDYAEQLGLLLRYNSIGIYSLNNIESYLINNISLIISSQMTEACLKKDEKIKCLFVATELYHAGGHTRLMERLAKFLDCKASLLITKKPSDSIVNREEGFFHNIYYDKSITNKIIEKVFFNLNIIQQFDLVVLNTHSEDICAIIACGIAKKRNKKLKIHFVNHADHLFSYGSSVSDVWYEVSAYGRCIDAKRELTAKKCFLGIPIDNIDIENKRNYEFENGDLIFTAGARIKFKPDDDASIIPLINALLEKYNKSSLQVVGANCYRDYWWWRSKFKYGKRLVISKSMPYEEYLKVTSTAKLYIDSHPFPGGTAFVEQYLQGRLCTGLISEYKGYSPVEIFKKVSVNDVVDSVISIGNNDFDYVNGLIIKTHGVENVKLRFINSLFSGVYESDFWRSRNDDISPVVKSKLSKIPVKMKIYSFKHLLFMYKVSTNRAFLRYILKVLVQNR